jgi:ubiquilin
MLSNPEALRSMMQMQQAMRGSGGAGGMGGGMGGMGGYGGFGSEPAATPGGAATPSALFNPWASNPPPAIGAGTGTQAGLGGANAGAGMEEFARMMAGMQGGGGFGGMGGGFGAPPPAVPAGPIIPPEERFEVQLGQLQEMGFYDTTRNIRALMATGGNTQAAIEYLFSMP